MIEPDARAFRSEAPLRDLLLTGCQHGVVQVVSIGAGLVGAVGVNDDHRPVGGPISEGRGIGDRAAPRLVIEFDQVTGQPLPLLLEIDVTFGQHIFGVFVVSDPVGDDQNLSVGDLDVSCGDDHVSLLLLVFGADLDPALGASAGLRDDRQLGRRRLAQRFLLFLRRADGIFDFLFDGFGLLRMRD